jgi:hypothetical protein
MSEPAAITYARSGGLLVGAILGAQPILARALASLGELNRRDTSPLMLSAMNEVAYVSQTLAQAIKDAEAIETTERTRRDMNIKED